MNTLSRWVDTFNTHVVHQQLKNILENNEKILKDKNTNPQAFEESQRIDQVLKQTRLKILNCDPILTPNSILDQINSSLNSVNNEVTYYIQNKNIAHLTNANNYIDSILVQMTNLSIPLLPEDFEGIQDAISEYRTAFSSNTKSLDEEYKKIMQVKEELQQGFEQLSSTVENQKSRLEDAISQFQKQTINLEEDRMNKFSTAEKERQDDLIAEINKITEKYTIEGNNYINKLEELKLHAEKLVNVIGNTGMSGSYKKTADREKFSADIWQVISFLSLLSLVIFAVASFWYALKIQFSWPQLGGRIFVASTFAALAAYTGRQASDHRKAELFNRKMELELASIEPYLVGMPDNVKHELKSSLAEKFFGQQPNIEIEKNSEETNLPTKDLIKLLLETVQAFAKNKPN